MSLLFKNYSLVEVVYMSRFKMTMFLHEMQRTLIEMMKMNKTHVPYIQVMTPPGLEGL